MEFQYQEAGTAASYATQTQTMQDAAPGEINALRGEIERYNLTIDELYSRLSSVLTPEYAEPGATSDHPMPVMSDIATLRSQFAATTSRLHGLLARIDL